MIWIYSGSSQFRRNTMSYTRVTDGDRQIDRRVVNQQEGGKYNVLGMLIIVECEKNKNDIVLYFQPCH